MTTPVSTDLLAHPALIPPPVAPGATEGLAWLRGNVARFASGEPHRRRRAQVADLLHGMDVEQLRERAAELAREIAVAGPVDIMERIARDVPVRVLAEAMGLAGVEVAAVRAVAAGYLSGEATAESDAAVEHLVAACGGVHDEPTAARIGLLVQACEATAALIGNTLAAKGSVAAQLRDDPPVRATVRVAVAEVGNMHLRPGDQVRIELAGDTAFGAGPHACPGRDQAIAIAIAAGVCDALRDVRLQTGPVEYAPLPNLRIPTRLEAAP
jgi:hypothetical protein